MESGINRNQIIGELSRSAHGDLKAYSTIINPACQSDPEFVAHLIAWDFVNGQIKDSKLAIPILSLVSREFPDELTENSLAHLAAQPPRELLKALRFSFQVRPSKRRQTALMKLVRQYLIHKLAVPPKWFRLAARHRRALHELHALSHCPMPEWASKILFCNDYTPGTIFHDIKQLHLMPPEQAAGVIQRWNLSPLIIAGAMTGAKDKQKDSSIVQAKMEQMSDTEIVTQAASLERSGLSRDVKLKETFRKKAAKATKSKKATLKTSVAAEAVEDEGLKEMLKELQERQIQTQKDAGRGLNGNWLVIGDKSSSMQLGIELSKHVSAAISKFVTGRVWLVFCDETAAAAEVTGMELDKIKAHTRFVRADGWTSIGVGLAYATQMKLDLDGVVIVSDGGENRPPLFPAAHAEYEKRMGKALPVYYYKVACGASYSHNIQDTLADSMRRAGIPMTIYDLTHGEIDYYSIPNLVQGMSANSFGVIDKIMACPLLTIEQVMPGYQNYTNVKGAANAR